MRLIPISHRIRKIARSILPDSELLNSILNRIGEAIDEASLVFKKEGYDLAQLARDYQKKPNQDILDSLVDVIDSNLPDWSDSSIPFSISIRQTPDDGAGIQYNRSGVIQEIQLHWSKTFLENLLKEWFLERNKKGVLKKLEPFIGHELVHKDQGGKSFDFDKEMIESFPKEEQNVIWEKVEDIRDMLPSIKRKSAECFKETTQDEFLNEFFRFYNLIHSKASVSRWKRFIPEYLKGYYDFLKKSFDQEHHTVGMAVMVEFLNRKVFNIFTDKSELNFLYYAQPKEIMAYAYSVVKDAINKKITKEKLLEIINNPAGYKGEFPGLDSYYHIKNMKSISDSKKQEVWKKFLTHIHGYMDSLYN